MEVGKGEGSRRLWNRRQEGRRPHITAREGGYVGHETNAGCPRPDIVLFYLNNGRCAVYHLHRLVFARLFKE